MTAANDSFPEWMARLQARDGTLPAKPSSATPANSSLWPANSVPELRPKVG